MPNWNTQNIGSSLSLPAHGRAGARATSSLAAYFAKRNAPPKEMLPLPQPTRAQATKWNSPDFVYSSLAYYTMEYNI